MSRLIKFRSWNHLQQAMRYPSDVSEMPMDTSYSVPSERKGTTYLQWTGLTDKNGKEIYEGDILSGGDVYGPWAVVWEVDGWVLKDGCALHAALGDKEVIGNIYENPDLLAV